MIIVAVHRRLAGIASAAAAVVIAAAAPVADAPVAGTTAEMAALLRQRAAAVDPVALGFIVNDRRADLLRAELARPRPLTEHLRRLQVIAVREFIDAGRMPEALETLAALAEEAKANDPERWRAMQASAHMLEATAHLRVGEDQNCHATSNRDACLLPIRGEGVHRNRDGSSRAIVALEKALAIEPGNLRARWLLNIAHMTLGTYPDGVPAPHRIPPETFRAEYPLPRFDNVAHEFGVDLAGLAGGAILEDFDRDGRLDLMVSWMGFEDQMRLFRNIGNGKFEDRTDAAGLTGEVGGLNMLQADYDNDGNVDVLVLRGGWLGSQGDFPFSLIRNNGDGTFRDVTREAGLTRLAPSQTAAWLDYDGDGWLDLFVGNEATGRQLHACELYRNNGDGTFTDLAREAGVAFIGFVKGVVAGDYDNDGRPDLYLSVLNGDNVLFRNDGAVTEPTGNRRWKFTNVAADAGVTGPRASFPAFFFDYDNDGWLDLFVGGYGRRDGGLPQVEDVAADYLGLPTSAERGRLYRNTGLGRFEDVTRAANLHAVVPAMGLNFGDVDNDGWLDFYAGTGTPDIAMLVPNRMFRNDQGRRFQDVTTAANVGHLQKGHGIAFGDIDNDGDQDVFEQMGGAVYADRARSALYRNPGNAHAWIGLELEGVRSNRKGVGARIEVVASNGASERVVHRVVGSGGSFGASPLRQEIGLGDHAQVRSVKVFWPVSGTMQVVTGLEARRRYRIREGSDRATPIDWPPSTTSSPNE